MSKGVLLDTNIFIYALNSQSEFHHYAIDLLQSDQDLYTTSKNISEYFAVSSKLEIDYNITFKFYNEIRANVEVLFPDEVSLELFAKMAEKYKPRGNRYYDLEVASIGISNNVSTIATANKKDFMSIEGIEVV